MTYAGNIFSWYAGSLEADVYFCPERHGTYFGCFYMLLHEGAAPSSATVLGLAEKYGLLDGEIAARYATAFAAVGRSLSNAQKAQLAALRKQVLGDLNPTGAYLCAELIPVPGIPSTDFLFF